MDMFYGEEDDGFDNNILNINSSDDGLDIINEDEEENNYDDEP